MFQESSWSCQVASTLMRDFQIEVFNITKPNNKFVSCYQNPIDRFNKNIVILLESCMNYKDFQIARLSTTLHDIGMSVHKQVY